MHIIFRIDSQDNGKVNACERGDIVHKCPKYEELQRLSSDRSLIEGAKTLVALTNHVLRKHRLELKVIDLEGATV